MDGSIFYSVSSLQEPLLRLRPFFGKGRSLSRSRVMVASSGQSVGYGSAGCGEKHLVRHGDAHDGPYSISLEG